MQNIIHISSKSKSDASLFILTSKKTNWLKLGFEKKEVSYIEKKIKSDEHFITINQFNRLVFIQLIEAFEKDKKTAVKRTYFNRTKLFCLLFF
jgi:hypothetical protein